MNVYVLLTFYCNFLFQREQSQGQSEALSALHAPFMLPSACSGSSYSSGWLVRQK